jgi:pyruvate-ferredoxin/flavodoxin oxidoreductase
MLVRLNQSDVVYRRHLDPGHRAFVPDFGVFIRIPAEDRTDYRAISRQLVLFCVERRKAWRLLQSQAGIVNSDYKAQRQVLADVDEGRLPMEELFARGAELVAERVAEATGQPPKAAKNATAGGGVANPAPRVASPPE